MVIEPSSLSEQEQIELAIGRSLQEATNSNCSNKTKNSDSDADDDEEDDNDDDEDEVNTFDYSSSEENITQSNEKLVEPATDKANQDMPIIEMNTETTEEPVTNSSNTYDNYLGLESGKLTNSNNKKINKNQMKY